MPPFGSSLLLATTLATTLALAQSPAPRDPEATSSIVVPLSIDKQREIKKAIAGSERGLGPDYQLPRVSDELTPGMAVPVAVPLITLPQDAMTELPMTSSYRFVLTPAAIAVIDPATRQVIAIIR